MKLSRMYESFKMPKQNWGMTLSSSKVEKVDSKVEGYEEALVENSTPLTKASMHLLRKVMSPRTIRLV